MNSSIKIPANVEVCAKPRKGLAALLIFCIIVLIWVIVWSLKEGKSFSLLLFVAIGFLVTKVRWLSIKTKMTPVLLDITCNNEQLVIGMPNTRLMSNGQYVNQRYSILRSNIKPIEFQSKGFVLLPISRMTCQAYDDSLQTLEEHTRENSNLGFVLNNDSISQFQEFLKSNNFEFVVIV